MELNDLVNLMTVDIYQRLLTAVELGKWPDGVALTPEQKENTSFAPIKKHSIFKFNSA